MYLVSLFLHHITEYVGLRVGTYCFLVLLRMFVLHETEFNLPLPLRPPASERCLKCSGRPYIFGVGEASDNHFVPVVRMIENFPIELFSRPLCFSSYTLIVPSLNNRYHFLASFVYCTFTTHLKQSACEFSPEERF